MCTKCNNQLQDYENEFDEILEQVKIVPKIADSSS